MIKYIHTKMYRKIFFLQFILSLVFIPIFSNAQSTFLPFSTSNELGIEMIPNYPRPNEKVYLSISLYTDDISSAEISWFVNGKLQEKGKGLVSFSTKLGNVGVETKIEIKALLLSGSSVSKTITLVPASVDIVWEAQSYTPPFYKGKALHPRQGVLKLVAVPEFYKDGKRIKSENLVYTWSNKTEVFQDKSGYGKNIIILNGSKLGDTDSIELLVTDPSNNLVADAFVDIFPTDPLIVFYRNDPFYGQLYNTSMPSLYDLKTEEVQLVASPYYFSKEKLNNMNYEWRINGSVVEELSTSLSAIFKKPEEAGESRISLQIENQNRILQSANKGVSIRFK